MRKQASIALALGTLVIAGCGGGGGSDAESPLDEALGYLPADTPFAVAIDTDLKGGQYSAAGNIVDQFPFGETAKAQLQGVVEDRAGDFKRFQEALGNEFVVGSTDAATFVNSPGGEDTKFVAAIQVTDADVLNDLLESEKAEKDGEQNGADLYRDDSGDSFAVKDDVLIVAGSKSELETALETRESGDGFTEEDFEAGTKGVPADALLRVYLNVGGLLEASPGAKEALKVKWVKALRTLGLALSFSESEVAIDFNMTTDPAGLTDADLPIASGATAPEVLDRAGEIGVALRDPAQIVTFAQAAAKSVDPEGFSGFEAGKRTIESQLGLSLEDDLIGQLKGDLSVSFALDGKFGARAELEDPAQFERTLVKLARVLPDVARGAVGEKVALVEPKPGDDLYALGTADGDSVLFGVVDGVLVVSNDPRTATTLASEGTKAVPGATGALVVGAKAEELVGGLLSQATGQIDRLGQLGVDEQLKEQLEDQLNSQATQQTGPLDDLVGSAEASTSGLSGSFKLTLDK